MTMKNFLLLLAAWISAAIAVSIGDRNGQNTESVQLILGDNYMEGNDIDKDNEIPSTVLSTRGWPFGDSKKTKQKKEEQALAEHERKFQQYQQRIQDEVAEKQRNTKLTKPKTDKQRGKYKEKYSSHYPNGSPSNTGSPSYQQWP